jgi:hypothetical protein
MAGGQIELACQPLSTSTSEIRGATGPGGIGSVSFVKHEGTFRDRRAKRRCFI